MTVLLLLGFAGLVLLVVALVFGDLLDGLVPQIELGDGLFSLPVLAGFVAAFGFCGAAVHALTGTAVLSLPAAAGGGIAVGWAAMRLTRSLLHMPTDPALRADDLIGREGRVITALRPGSLGEVLLTVGGQSLKYTARADDALATGADIVVVEVLSPTAVAVISADQFWQRREPTS